MKEDITINQLLEQLCNQATLHRLLSRFHVPCSEQEDICQDLYASWLQHPESILKAYSEGWLLQYLTRSCKNQAIKFRQRRTFVDLENVPESALEDTPEYVL